MWILARARPVAACPAVTGQSATLKNNCMTPIDSIVARLTSLHPKLIDLSLDRMRRILGSLGHPEQQLPPTIHVAGTNGKGSTIGFMRAIL